MNKFYMSCCAVLFAVSFGATPVSAGVSAQDCTDFCRGKIACWQWKGCKQDCSKISGVAKALDDAQKVCPVELNKELAETMMKQHDAKEKGNKTEADRLGKDIVNIKETLKAMMMG